MQNKGHRGIGSYGLHSMVCRLGVLAIFVLLMGGCATTSENGKDIDPYESFNRKMFTFNGVLDKQVAEPIASGYTKVTPEPVQTGVTNFFQNLSNINVVLNDFLQGKFKQGFADSGRFVINTTVGIAGLFDVAKKFGLEQHNEDFGQTLAVWGVNPGPYLVLPFLGPSTTRGTPSFAVEALTNPVVTAFPPLLGLELVDTRARADGAIKFVDEAALDPYIFTRESFLQWRNFLIYDGNPPVPELDDLEEELLAEEEELLEDYESGEDNPELDEAGTDTDSDAQKAETEEALDTECDDDDSNEPIVGSSGRF